MNWMLVRFIRMATANKNTFFRQKKLSMVAVDGRSKNHRGEKGRWLKKEEHEKVTEMVFYKTNLYLFAKLLFLYRRGQCLNN